MRAVAVLAMAIVATLLPSSQALAAPPDDPVTETHPNVYDALGRDSVIPTMPSGGALTIETANVSEAKRARVIARRSPNSSAAARKASS